MGDCAIICIDWTLWCLIKETTETKVQVTIVTSEQNGISTFFLLCHDAVQNIKQSGFIAYACFKLFFIKQICSKYVSSVNLSC